jgi:hypothetical protein
MKRTLLALLVLWCLPAIAQQTTTYQHVFTSAQTPGGGPPPPIVSPPLNSIGQSSHQILVTIHNNGASSCDTGTYHTTATLLGSYDNSTYVAFGNPINVTTDGNGRGFLTSLGTFPYIEVEITTTFSSNCAVDLWYTGSVAGIPPQSLTLSGGTFGLASNGAGLTEKSSRQAVSVSAAAGSAATTTISSTSSAQTQVLDCLTFSLQVQTTLASAQYTTVTIAVNSSSVILWQAYVGFPNGTAAGTSDRQTICGFALPSPYSNALNVGFSAGLTGIVQAVSVTYYYVNNNY